MGIFNKIKKIFSVKPKDYNLDSNEKNKKESSLSKDSENQKKKLSPDSIKNIQNKINSDAETALEKVSDSSQEDILDVETPLETVSDSSQEDILDAETALEKVSDSSQEDILDAETPLEKVSDSSQEDIIDKKSDLELSSSDSIEDGHLLKSKLNNQTSSLKKVQLQTSESSQSTNLTKKNEKLDRTLNKTRDGFFSKMKLFFSGKNKIDDDFLDQLEEMLITADVGVQTTVKIIDLVEKFVHQNKYVDEEELKHILKNEIINLLSIDTDISNKLQSENEPYVIIFVGVNGVGKTTSIAKIAHSLKKDGKKVIIGAADTFRAAAIDQLALWAKKIDIPIIKQDMGSDPASVAFDTVQSGLSNNVDFILIDTAGRLHNKINLMHELEKINNVVSKLIPNAPQEVVLVLDASTGQNALEQAKQFLKSTKVTHLALTKLDGTAKGGVVISICDQLSIPIKYIGVGEQIDDIQLFDRKSFVDSLFK